VTSLMVSMAFFPHRPDVYFFHPTLCLPQYSSQRQLSG
jgi:hypothetical protein